MGTASKKTQKEIERKFIINSIPNSINLQGLEYSEIKQYYLSVSNGTELRVRQENEDTVLTVKAGEGLSRQEKEYSVPAEIFEDLKPLKTGEIIEKTRYRYPFNGKVVEIDVYKGALQGLVVAEIEFLSVQEAKNFIAPEFFGKEVTTILDYKNRSLATKGLPILRLKEIKRDSKEKSNAYEKEEGLKLAIQKIQGLLSAQDRVIVMLAGGSASGKTSIVSSNIKNAFGDDCCIISMDDYYKGKKFVDEMAAKGTGINLDHPQAFDIALLKAHLAALKAGKTIEKPRYSFKTETREGYEKFDGKKVIVIEGLFTLVDELKDLGDLRLFVHVSSHGRFIRRLLRDITERSAWSADKIAGYTLSTVEQMNGMYVAPQEANADIVILNDYKRSEAAKAHVKELQIKIHLEKTMQFKAIMDKIGATPIAKTTQTDRYFLIDAQGNETLRLREEEGTRVLTYKAFIDGEEGMRARIDVNVEKDTAEDLARRYEKICEIRKNREIYLVDGVLINFDFVVKRDKDGDKGLGHFVEFRFGTKEEKEEKLQRLKEKLGLLDTKHVTTSYFALNPAKA